MFIEADAKRKADEVKRKSEEGKSLEAYRHACCGRLYAEHLLFWPSPSPKTAAAAKKAADDASAKKAADDAAAKKAADDAAKAASPPKPATPEDVTKAAADLKTVTEVPSPTAQSRGTSDATAEAKAQTQASTDCGCVIL